MVIESIFWIALHKLWLVRCFGFHPPLSNINWVFYRNSMSLNFVIFLSQFYIQNFSPMIRHFPTKKSRPKILLVAEASLECRYCVLLLTKDATQAPLRHLIARTIRLQQVRRRTGRFLRVGRTAWRPYANSCCARTYFRSCDAFCRGQLHAVFGLFGSSLRGCTE